MSTVIIDTTTLINLSQYAALEKAYEHITRESFYDIINMDALESALEALILYDVLLVDKESFENNMYRLEQLSPIRPLLTNIDISEEQSSAIQSNMAENIENIIISDEPRSNTIINFDIPKEDDERLLEDIYDMSVLDEMGTSRYEILLEDSYNPDILDKIGLSPFDNNYIQRDLFGHTNSANFGSFFMMSRKYPGFRKKFRQVYGRGTHFIQAEIAYIQSVRYLYYLELQKIAEAEIVLHPAKRFFNHRQEKVLYGSQILNMFESETREKLYDRKLSWLNIRDNSLLLPMLSAYVLKKAKNPSDILDVILEVRTSNEAVNFRKGLHALIEAIKRNDNTILSEVLANLDDKRKEWNGRLSYDPLRRSKKLSVSIPMVGGVGTEFDIPYSASKNTISNNLLTFIHRIVSES